MQVAVEIAFHKLGQHREWVDEEIRTRIAKLEKIHGG
jgi:hypothetical protein